MEEASLNRLAFAAAVHGLTDYTICKVVRMVSRGRGQVLVHPYQWQGTH
jgi:hypothetical protein